METPQLIKKRRSCFNKSELGLVNSNIYKIKKAAEFGSLFYLIDYLIT